MIVRRTEILLGLYRTAEERDKEIEQLEFDGYKVLETGAASFSKEDVEGTCIKPGEICLYAKYIK